MAQSEFGKPVISFWFRLNSLPGSFLTSLATLTHLPGHPFGRGQMLFSLSGCLSAGIKLIADGPQRPCQPKPKSEWQSEARDFESGSIARYPGSGMSRTVSEAAQACGEGVVLVVKAVAKQSWLSWLSSPKSRGLKAGSAPILRKAWLVGPKHPNKLLYVHLLLYHYGSMRSVSP